MKINRNHKLDNNSVINKNKKKMSYYDVNSGNLHWIFLLFILSTISFTALNVGAAEELSNNNLMENKIPPDFKNQLYQESSSSYTTILTSSPTLTYVAEPVDNQWRHTFTISNTGPDNIWFILIETPNINLPEYPEWLYYDFGWSWTYYPMVSTGSIGTWDDEYWWGSGSFSNLIGPDGIQSLDFSFVNDLAPKPTTILMCDTANYPSDKYGNSVTQNVIPTIIGLPDKPPIANAGDDVEAHPPTIPIKFDASASHHTDPTKQIVLYEWDFESDGIWDYSGTESTSEHAYPAYYNPDGSIDWDQTVKDYTATLRVTDDSSPELKNIDSCIIHITAPPWKPIADPNGPYEGSNGIPIQLDGSKSYDLEEKMFSSDHPWYETIAKYEWDLDFDGEFDDSTDAKPTWTWDTEGIYIIGLKVTDSQPSGPSGIIGPLDMDIKYATVIIKEEEPVTVFLRVYPNDYIVGPLEVEFNAYPSDGSSIAKYLWDWEGDGTVDHETQEYDCTHTYTTAGVFTPTVTIQNDQGHDLASDSATIINTAYDPLENGFSFANYGYYLCADILPLLPNGIVCSDVEKWAHCFGMTFTSGLDFYLPGDLIGACGSDGNPTGDAVPPCIQPIPPLWIPPTLERCLIEYNQILFFAPLGLFNIYQIFIDETTNLVEPESKDLYNTAQLNVLRDRLVIGPEAVFFRGHVVLAYSIVDDDVYAYIFIYDSNTAASDSCKRSRDVIQLQKTEFGLYHMSQYGGYDVFSVSAPFDPNFWYAQVPIQLNIFSPVDVEVTAPDGRVIGKDVNQFPNGIYKEVNFDSGPDIVVILPSMLGDYSIKVMPKPDAQPSDIFTIVISGNGDYITLAENIPISEIPDQPYILRRTETGIVQIIPATIDFDPDTLNLNSEGNWITTYIELPEGYDVSNIDTSTIMLNGQIQAENNPTEIGDCDEDGITDIMVKFDRSVVQGILELGDEIALTITGELTGEILFEGADTIQVIQ